MNKRVILAVTNDLSGDQRIHKVAVSLIRLGYQPVLAGRLLPASVALNRPYRCRRFRLPFRKGPLFYIAFNFRLFLYLIFVKAGIFLANDLDTLPAVFLAGMIRGKKVVYDSHEYFTEVPELVDRRRIKKVWERIERLIFPRLTAVYTVNSSIAGIYSARYGVPVGVVRNVPSGDRPAPVPGFLPAGFTDRPVLIYQGAVNVGRGLEQVIKAMPLLPECHLLIVGDGDIRRSLDELVERLGLGGRVFFTGRVPFEHVSWYTTQATLGISLEQDTGLNYHFALPNKLFDYLHAGLPVIASDLPEIRQIVENVNFGMIVDRFDPESLSKDIRSILNNPELLEQWRKNALEAAPLYTWENEEKVLQSYFPPLFDS
jgi:glycosyltransferase involved in cell wall biosynthesis